MDPLGRFKEIKDSLKRLKIKYQEIRLLPVFEHINVLMFIHQDKEQKTHLLKTVQKSHITTLGGTRCSKFYDYSQETLDRKYKERMQSKQTISQQPTTQPQQPEEVTEKQSETEDQTMDMDETNSSSTEEVEVEQKIMPLSKRTKKQ
jgi:hypothetical protein